ncbi:MAG TPA: hypothetical protein VH743_22895 [Beijerinckiaceae bacterium]|jgi:hypothetical protein
MKYDIRDRYGHTINECIQQVINELSRDAIGLWNIVIYGREDFGLSGGDLADFVRRHLLAIFAHGAKPVVGASDNIHIWTPVDYGGGPEEVANAIVSEWIQTGHEPGPGGLWFALPHVYQEKRGPEAPDRIKSRLS